MAAEGATALLEGCGSRSSGGASGRRRLLPRNRAVRDATRTGPCRVRHCPFAPPLRSMCASEVELPTVRSGRLAMGWCKSVTSLHSWVVPLCALSVCLLCKGTVGELQCSQAEFEASLHMVAIKFNTNIVLEKACMILREGGLYMCHVDVRLVQYGYADRCCSSAAAVGAGRCWFSAS